jgi:hypothetical protein
MASAPNERAFEYDVAFSFLARDEELATALTDLLQDRFRCFLYSRQQELIAGTDGEVTFNRVFGEAARIVVILYRDGWGQSPWTRIEETAIRNRAYSQGYDFALFVKLNALDELPAWIPKTYIFHGYERWGLQGAASVIEARVEGAGGAPHQETPTELARRLQREQERARARVQFLHSESGVSAAAAEFRKLVQATRDVAGRLQEDNPALQMRLEEADGSFVAYRDGHSLTYGWQLLWANTFDGSTLFVRLHRGAIALRGYSSSKVKQIASWEFDFDLSSEGNYGWRLRSGDRRFYSSAELADWAVAEFLKRLFSS